MPSKLTKRPKRQSRKPFPPRSINSSLVVNCAIMSSTINSSAGGLASGVFSSAYATTSTDFTAYASLFWQARILRARYRWMPFYNAVTPAQGTGFYAIYNEDTALATPTVQSLQYRSDAKVAYVGQPFTAVWHAKGPSDLLYSLVAAVPIRGGMAFAFQGCAASQPLGLVAIDADIEFTRN